MIIINYYQATIIHTFNKIKSDIIKIKSECKDISRLATQRLYSKNNNDIISKFDEASTSILSYNSDIFNKSIKKYINTPSLQSNLKNLNESKAKEIAILILNANSDTIREVINFIPEEIIARNVKYFSENTRVIFDEYLWFYCLFETFENFHEITVYFIDEDKKTEFYTSSKEAYCYFLFSSLSKSILQLTNYPFLLQISETRHNLAPLYFNFKYLGSSHNFLIFNSNN